MKKIEPTTLAIVVILVGVVAVAHYVQAAELVTAGVSALAVIVAGLTKSMVKGSGDAGQ